MDPGNYKGGLGCIRAYIAMAAAEYGDEKVRKDALDQVDNEYFPVTATPSGALYNKGASVQTQCNILMARLMRYQDLANAELYGPEPVAMTGPLLQDAKFPDVLVAKAYSADGKSLDLVLYNGKAAGKQTLGFERLIPGAKYTVGKYGMTADQSGKGTVEVELNGRTPLMVSPV